MTLSCRSIVRLAFSLGVLATCTTSPLDAWAQADPPNGLQTPTRPAATTPSAGVADEDSGVLPAQSTIPPPVGNPFIQYGVAFTTEFVATPGAMCSGPASGQPCILGSGGGIVFPRIGWRSAGAWYFGFAYEMSKQDAFTLYRLPILQQLRVEARDYFLIGQVLTPFVGAAAGLAGYGDEWAVNTFGPDASVTFGVEAQVARGTVVALALNYRTIYFRSFVDSSNTARDAGLAQLIGLDLQLEVRDPN